MEPYQKKLFKKHKKMKFKILGLGKNRYKTKGLSIPSYERSKSAPPIGESQYFGLSAFETQEDLNLKIWRDNLTLKKEIREKLLKIAYDFYENLGLKAQILDITFTGSLANYNWSKYSDIDLHIIIDYKDVDENVPMVKDLLNLHRLRWNKKHNIKIKGFEVEIYIQNITETHASSGVYSIMKNNWVIKPTKIKPVVDQDLVFKKSKFIMDMINDIENLFYLKKYEEAVEASVKLKDKIRNFRKAGLNKAGEFSVENLSFKTLRRNGYLNKLDKLMIDSYDRMMTINGPAKRDINKGLGHGKSV